MLSGRILAIAGVLVLLLVAAVPVDAAPALQKGVHSTYSLSVMISFLQSCETLATTMDPSSLIVCPMAATFPASTNITGTLGWAVTDLTSIAVSLNVTHDLTVSSGESIRPVIRNVGSFNESVDLATRLVKFFPNIMPEMDQFLQIAHSTSGISITGFNLTSSMTMLESVIPHPSVYTMWWVNGPLKLNQTVPVLVLPTNVTRSSTIDLGGTVGSRDAWSLDFNLSRPMILPDPSTGLASIPGGGLEAGFVFNYDKTSDLLLTASAELHSGFEDVITMPPTPCVPSPSMECPGSPISTMILGNFGVNISASLKLTSTTVDLSQRMTPTPSQQSSGGSDNGNGSGTNGGTGSDSRTDGSGSNSRGNGANGSTGQPSGATNQPGPSGQTSPWLLWVLGFLGVLAAVIITSAVWLSRRRRHDRLRQDEFSHTTS